jgi:hypothetical protein
MKAQKLKNCLNLKQHKKEKMIEKKERQVYEIEIMMRMKSKSKS